MKILFYQNNIPNKTQIIKLWEKEFKKTNEDIDLLPETTVGILSLDNILSGIVFLLFPTKSFLEQDSDLSNNLIEQKVTLNDCYLYNFCITSNEQKKGYGKKLLEKAEEYVKKQGSCKIILFVEGNNVPAIKLYNKHEYRVQRAIPNGFIMEKIL